MKEINKVEVLITTMNLNNPKDLLEKMNIESSAMIGNQTNKNEISEITYKSEIVKVYSFNERGVGLNRNNLLLRSNSDICLFGDDDLVYYDNYVDKVKYYFKKYPDADMIIFNLEESKPERFYTKKDFKVNYLNFMRFGAARLAVKTKKVSMNAITFNTNFGGGTQFSNGEDTLFIASCLKNGFNIYAVNETIAKLEDERESTWFKGYDSKYFNDKGILYYTMSKKLYKFLCLQDAVRHHKRYGNQSIFEIYKLMITSVDKYLKEI